MGPREHSSLSHHAIQTVPLPSALRCGQDGQQMNRAHTGKDYTIRGRIIHLIGALGSPNQMCEREMGLEHIWGQVMPPWSRLEKALRTVVPECTIPDSKPGCLLGRVFQTSEP